MDRYYPEKNSLKPALSIPTNELKDFAGEYRVNRFAYHDFTKVASWFGRLHITVTNDSKLKTVLGEDVDYWIPVDKLTFRKEHSSDVIEFKKGTDGKVQTMFIGGLPILALDKMSGIDTSSVHNTIMIVALVY